MATPLRVLFAEDSPDDVELEGRELMRAGYVLEHERVQTADDLRAALARGPWHLVIADYNMPAFDGLQALAIVQEAGLDVPFILISGTIGEDVAVRAMKGGAHDYLIKGQLARLGAAVKRELREAEIRAEHRRAAASQTFLARVGAALTGSLEFRALLDRAAALAVPDLADGCAIEVREEGGALRQVAVAPASGLPEPGQGGAPLVVPLEARGSSFGQVTFVAAAGRYEPLDRELAAEFVRRIALSADNARLFENARQAIKLRDDFLLVASHELNTPLTALRLQLDRVGLTLARPGNAPPQITDAIAHMSRSMERVETLVDRLLVVSSMAVDARALSRQPTDMLELVRQVAERFRPEADAASCALEVVAGGEPLLGSWDGGRIDQALAALLSNAVKFGAGRPIQIRAAADGHNARVEVCDQGIGVAPEDLERIFGRFERAVSTSHYGGLGLGLYLARQIVEAHGGSLKASGSPGAGATFTMLVPRA